MTKPSAKKELEAVILSFFDGPETAEPDIKALARLLRGKTRLPKGFRTTLAEILDFQFPGELAMNWALKPEFIGRNDEGAIEANEERRVKKAVAREGNISRAAPKVEGISHRTVWRVWNRIKLKRSWLETMIANAPVSDDVKERVRRAWRLDD